MREFGVNHVELINVMFADKYVLDKFHKFCHREIPESSDRNVWFGDVCAT